MTPTQKATPATVAYGSWPSTISAESLARSTLGLGQIQVTEDGLFWLESRPAEGGRQVVVKAGMGEEGKESEDMFSDPYNARNKVHEYGGGDFLVHRGVLYFTHQSDQRIYRVDHSRAPQAITPEGPFRYADLAVDELRERLLAVREEHHGRGEPHNSLVALPLAGDAPPAVLAHGCDFYACPRISPDGHHLSWLSWNHPDMPWDGCELYVAELNPGGDPGAIHHVAGSREESIFQPQWSPDNRLHFVSDRTGWWNLFVWDGKKSRNLCPMEAEFALPQWVFGQSTYAFVGDESILSAYNQGGRWTLCLLNRQGGKRQDFDLPFSQIESVRADAVTGYFIASSPTCFPGICALNLSNGKLRLIKSSLTDFHIDGGSDQWALPEPIDFLGYDGQLSHAWFVPPHNPHYQGPKGESPPLIVKVHSGPTAATSTGLDLGVQFWTSRGFAVLSVDYGGSTGYGRSYRQRLDGLWGRVDAEDCLLAALYLQQAGRVDGGKMAITGNSAGGFTALSALAFHKGFSAGTSLYGVADLEALAHDTHKFEAHYLDRLVAPYPAGEAVYRERSPLHHAQGITCPVLLLQGLEDKVVPPAQSDAMFRILREKGLPVAYLRFEGEGHGFKLPANRKKARDAELYFYRRIFGLHDPDGLEPLVIENF